MDKFLFIPCKLKCTAYFPDDLNCLIKVKHMLFLEDLFESFPPDILHGKVENAVFFTHGVCLDDVGMGQFSSCPCFVEKPLDIFLVGCKFFMKHFQCYRSIQRDLPCQINHSHAATAQSFFQKEISDHGTRRQRTFRNIYFRGTIRTWNRFCSCRNFCFNDFLTICTINLHFFLTPSGTGKKYSMTALSRSLCAYSAELFR